MKLKASVKTLAVALLGMALATTAVPSAFASGGPGSGGGGGLSAIANTLHGPWESLIGQNVVTMTFNNNGTFTATIQFPGGQILTDAGTFTLTPTSPPLPFGNAQGDLVLVDTQGIVFLSGDVLLLTVDQLVMLNATGSVTGVGQIGEIILNKMTP